MPQPESGKCLCGAVTLTISDMSHKVGVCHCETCRNWGGGPFISIEANDKVVIDGQDSVRVYNSSDWAERAFCKECGTHLFYRIKQNQGHFVLAGLMGSAVPMELEHQLFIDQKPEFYSFSQQTPTFTGEQVFAMFSEGSES